MTQIELTSSPSTSSRLVALMVTSSEVHPDVLHELLSTIIRPLLGVEADALCGPDMDNAAASAPISEAATGIANSTPGQGHRIWRPQAAAWFLRSGLAAGAP